MRPACERRSEFSLSSLRGPSWTDLERIRYLRRLIVTSQARLLELNRSPRSNDREASLEGACLAGFLRELRKLTDDLAADQMLDIRCLAPTGDQEIGDDLFRQGPR